ncbi:MAG: hypothetical protein ACTS8S_00885 [Giesbergeria sp.]
MNLSDASKAKGRVFDTNNGLFFEYTLGEIEPGRFEVYAVHMSDNVARQFGHVLVDVGLDNLLLTIGVRRDVWMKKAKGTLQQRAECILDIAAVYGWDVIDDSPQEFSREELHRRWYDGTQKEGPVTSAQLYDSPVISVELLLALHSVDQDKYWSMFSGNFPVIPPEAIQNSHHLWWRQHGAAAVTKIVEAIRDVCPPGFEFCVKDARWGFWKRDTLSA